MAFRSRFERKLKEHQTAIVLYHGFTSQTNNTVAQMKADLEARDYVVITPVLFDITDPTDINSKHWIARAKLAAVEAVEEYGRVIVAGHSMGSLMAAYVAATVPGIERVALLSGPFDMMTFATAKQGLLSIMDITKSKEEAPNVKQFYLTEEHHKTLLEIYDDLHFSPSKIDIPVLLVHGDADDVVDVSASKAAYKMIKHDNKDLIIIHGANHDINENNPGRTIIVDLMDAFINKHYDPEVVVKEIEEVKE